MSIPAVEANASLESIAPHFAVEQHLHDLFEEGPQDSTGSQTGPAIGVVGDLDPLPSSEGEHLISPNSAKSDWISKVERQDRDVKGDSYQRRADLFLSKTDLDASPMKRKRADHSHLGYQAHCVVDDGKARIILGVLVSPFEVTENKPMLDMLWRDAFSWKSWPTG
jgi:hypothetical protein